MAKFKVFKCKSKETEDIPKYLLTELGFDYNQVYTTKEGMAAIAEAMMKEKHEIMCKLPFSVVIEASAMGAKVSQSNTATPPALDAYMIKNIEDIVNLPDFDFSHGEIREVLDCVNLLHERGNVVTLKVEAPFTILGLLVDIATICINLHTSISLIEQAMDKISDNVIEYIRLAVESGASIISFADPTGVIEFVGPEVAERLSGKYNSKVLKAVSGFMGDKCVVHLCGRTSYTLESAGFCTTETIKLEAGSYGAAVYEMAKRPDVAVIGHNCLNITNLLQETSIIHKIIMK